MKHLTLPILTLSLLAHADATLSIEQRLQELSTKVEQNSQELQEVLPIIEAVEKKSIVDRLDLSPELELRVDKLDYKLGKIEGEETPILTPTHPMYSEQRRDEFSKNFEPAGSVNFKLNMRADLAHDLKFYGRMVINRSSQSNERLCILSRDIKTSSSETGMDVDRAYFDYSLLSHGTQKTILSFGILPTSGGTPSHFSHATQRKSMFPSLVF